MSDDESPLDSSKWTEQYWAMRAKWYISGTGGAGQLGQHTQLCVLSAMAEEFHARTGDWLYICSQEVEDIDIQRQYALEELLAEPPKLRAVPQDIKTTNPPDDRTESSGCQGEQIDAAAEN